MQEKSRTDGRKIVRADFIIIRVGEKSLLVEIEEVFFFGYS